MRNEVRLASVWFLYLGGLGLFLPYYGLYLQENLGLTGSQIGLVTMVIPFAGLAFQPLWGQVADRTGSRSRVLAMLMFGATVGHLLLYLPTSALGMVFATLALAACHTSVIPMTFSVTLASLRNRGPHHFGLVRVWGTVGFLVFVVAFPPILHWIQRSAGWRATAGGPSEPGLEIMFLGCALAALAAGTLMLGLPRGGALALRAPKGDWRRLVRHRPYMRLIGFVLLTYFFLHGGMIFFPVLVRSHDGSIDAVSRMWIMMLALEIPLIALSGATLARLGSRGLLTMGVVAGGLRWLACGFAPNLAVIYVASLLHGLVVAGLVIGAPLYVEETVPERLRSTGQALLAMAGISIGAGTSVLASGWLVDGFGIEAPYRIGGIGALALALLLPLWLPSPSRPPAAEGEEGFEVSVSPDAT